MDYLDIDVRFQLIESVFSRTYGDLWSARDTKLNRLVMIKSMPPDDNQSVAEILYEDALLFSRLTHPNILPVYDYRTDRNGYPYIVTLYVPELLSQLLESGKLLSISKSLRLLQQLAEAIDFLHQHEITHYNFKPRNIHVSEDGIPYVSHALRRRDAEFYQKQGLVFGSPAYVSPEVARSKVNYVEHNPHVDIYAFGISMFDLLTGQLPFAADDPTQVLLQHIQEDLPSCHKIRNELPIGIDIILQRLCAKKPEDRYQTAGKAIDDLTKIFYSGQSNIEGKIFISYARKDSEYVHQLASELRRIGLDLWIDQDIEPGSNWDEAIENGLNDCDMMLLITTDASMSSEYVTHEWSYFMGGGKPVYPFIPQTPIPNNIHPRLSRVQHVVGTDDMLNNVARIVDVLAGGTPTKLGGTENQG